MNDLVRFIKKSDQFQVALDSNASTGYVWKLVSTENFDLVGFKPSVPYNPQTMGVGSSIELIYTLKPKQVGELLLRFEKQRPWEKHSSPLKVYEEIIMVSE